VEVVRRKVLFTLKNAAPERSASRRAGEIKFRRMKRGGGLLEEVERGKEAIETREESRDGGTKEGERGKGDCNGGWLPAKIRIS